MRCFNPLFAGLTLKVHLPALTAAPVPGFNPLFAGLTLKVKDERHVLLAALEGFNPLFAGLTLKAHR